MTKKTKPICYRKICQIRNSLKYPNTSLVTTKNLINQSPKASYMLFLLITKKPGHNPLSCSILNLLISTYSLCELA